MRKVTIGLIIGFVFIFILIVVAFLFWALVKPNHQKMNLTNPVSGGSNLTEFSVSDVHVTYLLNEMGAYQLRNTPLSDEPSRIEVQVGSDVFTSEINDGKISTRRGKAEGADLRIITTKQEIVNSLTSLDIKEHLKNSVKNGKTQLELVAGYTTLFSKGYLSLYGDLTGKSLTGSVIRIFAG